MLIRRGRERNRADTSLFLGEEKEEKRADKEEGREEEDYSIHKIATLFHPSFFPPFLAFLTFFAQPMSARWASCFLRIRNWSEWKNICSKFRSIVGLIYSEKRQIFSSIWRFFCVILKIYR